MAAAEEECSSMVLRLMQVTTCDSEESRQEVNRLLDLLNSLNYGAKTKDEQVRYPTWDVSVQDGERVLCHCAATIPLPCEHLVAKFCTLVVHLMRHRQLPLSDDGFEVLLTYTTSALRHCRSWMQSYVLHALATLLYNDSARATKFVESFVGSDGILCRLASDGQCDVETRWCALKCIQNLAVRTSPTVYMQPDDVQRCHRLLMENLRRSIDAQTDELTNGKILVTCLTGIHALVTGANLVDVPALGQLLAILKCLVFFRLPGYSTRSSAVSLYPSPLSQDFFVSSCRNDQSSGVEEQSCKPRKKRAVKQKKRASRRPDDEDEASVEAGSSGHRWTVWPKCSSSESEYSDSEAGNALRLRQLQSRVRQCSLVTLAGLFKTVDRKVMFGYWSSFVPDSPSSSGTLMSSVLKDPAQKVRSAALAAVAAMLDGARPFLSMADERDTTRAAFTALSSTLASTVRELHRNLILALVSETSPFVLTQVVKCVLLLVQNVPVHKMAQGFLSKLIAHLRPLMMRQDPNVRVAVLTSVRAIVALQPPMPEVTSALFDESPETPWLLGWCVDGSSSVPLPLRVEMLQLLAAVVANCFPLVRRHLPLLVERVSTGLQDAEATISLHSAKLLEEVGRGLASDGQPNDSSSVAIWSALLTTLARVLQDETQSTVRAQGCNCLSVISSTTFELLPLHQRVFCQTVLLGLAQDEDKGVRAAACRALGVFVLYPSLLEDSCFVADVAEVLVVALEDANVEVRVKAAWSLANVTEALVATECPLSDSVLLALGRCARATALDAGDRVRSNGVRAIGNLLRCFGSQRLAADPFSLLVQQCIDAVVKCAASGSNMKARWNACYALGNMFRSRELLDVIMPARVDILVTLACVARSCKNFKVRINAAAVLAVPPERRHFGTAADIALVFEHLLDGLENIQASTDFVEYQYKDGLVDQQCSSLCHLASLVAPDDLRIVGGIVSAHRTTLRTYLCRAATRRPSVHCQAETHLLGLTSEKEAQSLATLRDAFTVDVE